MKTRNLCILDHATLLKELRDKGFTSGVCPDCNVDLFAERPITIHFDEEMRDHVAFIVRRYLMERKYHTSASKAKYDAHYIALTEKCLKELDEAGT